MDPFGQFLTICKSASVIPVCQLFVDRTDKICSLNGLDLGAVRILDLGDILACLLSICMLLYVAYRTHSKFAAVGRAEMNIFTFFYMLLLISQIISVGGWVSTSPAKFRPIYQWVTIIHVGLITATSWVLFLNGFVGFQLVEDGTPLSIYGIFMSAIVVFLGTGYIAADTMLGWTTKFVPGANLVSIPLYALNFVVPGALLLLYVIIQVFLVTCNLSQRKPLLWLLLAVFLFAAAQAFTFFFSTMICKGAQYIDGKLFSTLLTLGAYISVFKYWSSITEDEWEDFEDHF
ncbi:hypothetical protein RI367_000271 [Sorochytrium milnesiophthora]